MDVNNENEDRRLSDSEMVTDDKISTATTATVSPVSTPDVEMSETESTMGQRGSSNDNEIIQNEVRPPMSSDRHPNEHDRAIQKSNDQNSRSEGDLQEATNETSIIVEMTSPDADSDALAALQNRIDHDENSSEHHERFEVGTNQNFQSNDTIPTVGMDGLTTENQIPMIAPNTNPDFVEMNNQQSLPLEGSPSNNVEISDQSLVANEVRPSATNSDEPTMDTFQVLKI